MAVTQRAAEMLPKLLKVKERAKRDSRVRFTSLAHLLDENALERAFSRLRKGAAVGVDGVTKEAYGLELERNLIHGSDSDENAEQEISLFFSEKEILRY